MTEKKNKTAIHNSAAEYLIYVATIGNNADSMEMSYEDENIWLTQRMTDLLYDVIKIRRLTPIQNQHADIKDPARDTKASYVEIFYPLQKVYLRIGFCCSIIGPAIHGT